MANTIPNGKNRPLTFAQGTIPEMSGALKDYFQPMVFTRVLKETIGFSVKETPTPVEFMGILQPFTERQLMLKPEGQRSWTWFLVHADPVLSLNTDEVIIWQGKQTRVMARKNFAMYAYIEYHLVQDWEGAGP